MAKEIVSDDPSGGSSGGSAGVDADGEGEFDPLLVYGGPESGSEAWNGTEWTLPPFVDYTTGKDVFLVTGLCNDQGGYVIRDNEYHSLLNENEEVNIVCKTGGTEYTYAMQSLIESTAA